MSDINQKIVERFIPQNIPNNITISIEEKEQAGYQVVRSESELTIKVGQLVGDNLIQLCEAIQTLSKTTGTISATPIGKELKSGLIKLNHAVICAMVPVDMRTFVSTEIISRDPEAEKYWQGFYVTTSADEINVEVSEYLPVSTLNRLFTGCLKNASLTGEVEKRGGWMECDNLELLRSRGSRLERLTGMDDRFMIPALFLLAAVAIGTGLHFSGAFRAR